MIYYRKYCIYVDRDTLGISTLPTDMFHRDKKGTIAGGFISIDTDLAEITLSGKSEEFGCPTMKQICEAISNNGYYLEKGDKDYTWIVIDESGERIVLAEYEPNGKVENTYIKDRLGISFDSTYNFAKTFDSDEFKLIESLEHLLPERNSIPFVATTKIGRNDKCSCGSNKKYKNCCGK